MNTVTTISLMRALYDESQECSPVQYMRYVKRDRFAHYYYDTTNEPDRTMKLSALVVYRGKYRPLTHLAMIS